MQRSTACLFLLNEKLFYLAFDSVFLPSYSTEGRKEGEERGGRREGGREGWRGKKRNREQGQNQSHLILNLPFLGKLASCILGWRYDYQREGNELKKKIMAHYHLASLPPVQLRWVSPTMPSQGCPLTCEQSSVSVFRLWGCRSGIMFSLAVCLTFSMITGSPAEVILQLSCRLSLQGISAMKPFLTKACLPSHWVLVFSCSASNSLSSISMHAQLPACLLFRAGSESDCLLFWVLTGPGTWHCVFTMGEWIQMRTS